jgi:hypothetical protein
MVKYYQHDEKGFKVVRQTLKGWLVEHYNKETGPLFQGDDSHGENTKFLVPFSDKYPKDFEMSDVDGEALFADRRCGKCVYKHRF